MSDDKKKIKPVPVVKKSSIPLGEKAQKDTTKINIPSPTSKKG